MVSIGQIRLFESNCYWPKVILLSGAHCIRVFKWPLAVADSWPLFRGMFSTNFSWAGFRPVNVDRWPLYRGGR